MPVTDAPPQARIESIGRLHGQALVVMTITNPGQYPVRFAMQDRQYPTVVLRDGSTVTPAFRAPDGRRMVNHRFLDIRPGEEATIRLLFPVDTLTEGSTIHLCGQRPGRGDWEESLVVPGAVAPQS